MSARQEIADALSAVDGLTVTPYFSQNAKPGQGHVRLAQKTPDSRFPKDFVDTWQVLLPLSQDVASAEQFWESIQSAVLEALDPVMYVTQVEFADLQFDTGSVPGAVITGTREA